MTTKVQTGPFQFISKSETTYDLPSKTNQWPKQDLIKYAAFLNFSKTQISKQEQAFSWSFLRKMSVFIQTKNPNQCRIFHKKMMENFSSLDLLVADLRSKIVKFEEWYDLYEPSLRNVKHCLQRETMDVEKQLTKSISQNAKNPINESVVDEKIKDDERPTGVDYPEETLQAPKRSNIFNKLASRPLFGFQSFGEFDGIKPNNSLNDFDFFNNKRQEDLIPLEKKLSSKGQEWRECHNSFVNYLQKLNKAMGVSQQ